MIILLLAAFTLGVLTKLVDLTEEHGYELNKFLKYSCSIIYGLLLTYLVVTAPLTSFWLGTITGLILAGKIDAPGHYVALSVFLLGLIHYGLNEVNLIILLTAGLISWFDEFVNDEIIDKNRVKGWVKKFLEVRPFLEITSVIISIIYSNLLIFFTLFSFDTGYYLTNKFKTIILKKP